MKGVSIRHFALVVFVGCLVAAAPGYGQIPWPTPLPPELLDYREVPFRGELISRDDPRFRLAEAGFLLRGGVRLVSRDRALYSISWFDGSTTSGRLHDGRAIVILPHTFGNRTVESIRVARTPELAGGYTGWTGRTLEAPSHPDIPGYRYVMSENLSGSREYLGLWQRIRGPDETLIVSFRPAYDDRYRRAADIGQASHQIVGRLPMRLNSLFVYMTLHGLSWDLNFVSEAPVGRPIYILHYTWHPEFYRPLRETARDAPAQR